MLNLSGRLEPHYKPDHEAHASPLFDRCQVPTVPKLTAGEYRIIARHNAKLIDGAERDAMRCRQWLREIDDPILRGQLKYWQHAIQAFKWSTAVAAQMAKVAPDAGCSAE